MKLCYKCKILKPLERFSKDRTVSDDFCAKCKECTEEYRKPYENKNQEKIKIRKQKYYLDNKDIINNRNNTWRQENSDKINSYTKNRKENDIIFRLSMSLRQRLNKAVKHNYKSGSAVSDLGCSIEFFKSYLESLFQPGMTWENYGKGNGKWNIDHILPLAIFDLTNREQLLKVCHYTNMQPMWAIDNIIKSDKV